MNVIQKNNLRILNLAELGHSGRTLMRILSGSNGKKITSETVVEILGNTPTALSILNDLSSINSNVYSVYCLLYFGVNLFIVEKIRDHFSDLTDISKRFNDLKNLYLHDDTIDKIYNALNELSLIYCDDLKNEILQLISNEEICPVSTIKEVILNKYSNITSDKIDDELNTLVENKKIMLTWQGFKINNVKFEDFFVELDDKDRIVLEKVKGKTLSQIADKKNLTRERIRQIIAKRIQTYPIFYDEERYLKVISNYSLNPKEMEIIGLRDKNLIGYIKTKYIIKTPNKTSLDYLHDNKLINTECGEKILELNNLIYFNGELVSRTFPDLFNCFLKSLNIHSFVLDDFVYDYNKFLIDHSVSDNKLMIGGKEDLKIKSRKLSNRSSLFLNVAGNKFIVNDLDSLSFDFIDETENYISNFEGYGSVGLFFNNHTNLCIKNNINDENELFALLKSMYSQKYEDKIEFIRNPTIIEKGIDKNKFLESLILDLNLPCTVDDYLNYIYKTTGLKQASIASNFTDLINRYKNTKGLISLEEDVTEYEYEYLIILIAGLNVIGTSYLYEKVRQKFGDRTQLILNENSLKKIGYSKTNTSIYSTSFTSRYDAVVDAIKNSDYILDDSDLIKISDLEYFYYRFYDFIDSGCLVKIGKNKYLNILKRNQVELYKNLKKEICNLCDNEKIYVLEDFLESEKFLNMLNKNVEYKNFLYTFDTNEIMKFIISTSRELYYFETSGNLIFSKADVSLKVIVMKIMEENAILTNLELQEILYNDYRIERQFTNGELQNMGLYCPCSSEKIYLNKDYFEQEMEVLLNGNS